MSWFRITLTDAEQAVVDAERDAHPDAHVRRKMLVLRFLHCGVTRAKAAEVAGLGRATVPRYVAAYRDGGLDGLRQWGVVGPVSDLAAHTEAIRPSLTSSPVRTVAEACDGIEAVTVLRRQPTQVRAFPAGLGFKWRCVRAIPIPQTRLPRPCRRPEGVPRRRNPPGDRGGSGVMGTLLPAVASWLPSSRWTAARGSTPSPAYCSPS